MAEDASEKQQPPPRQSAEIPAQPLHDDASAAHASESLPTDEKAAMKLNADDSSQGEDHAQLRKLDSAHPKSNDKASNKDPFGHLPPDQAAILKRQVDTPDVKVGLATLYRYSTRIDLILLAVGGVCSIAAGAILPVMTVVFGSLQGAFANYFSGLTTYNAFMDDMTRLVLYFVYLGIGMFFAVYICKYLGATQGLRMSSCPLCPQVTHLRAAP